MENSEVCGEQFFDATPEITESVSTPTNESTTTDNEEETPEQPFSLQPFTEQSFYVPRDAQIINNPPKRSTRLSKKTPIKAKSSKSSIKNEKQTIEIGVLTAQMVTLTNALQTLQKTAQQQQSEIDDLKEEKRKLAEDIEKNFDMKLGSLEKRLDVANNLREKSFATKEVLETTNKKIEKMSSQVNAAIQSSSNAEKKFTTATTCQEMQEEIKGVRSDLNNLCDDVVAVKQTLHSMEDTTPFTPVRTQRSPDNSAADNIIPLENSLDDISVAEIQSTPVVQKREEKVENKKKWSDDEPQNSTPTKKHPVKTLMFMDSNRAHIDAETLWRNLSIIPCKDLDTLRNLLAIENFDGVEVVFIHTGVNDIDTKDGEEVAKDITNIVNRLHHLHPHLKIIVSEVTPRKQFRDDQVVECNRQLQRSFHDVAFVTIARHSNLRNDKWTFHRDDKHLTQVSISMFASNLKNALRRCLGIQSKRNMKGGDSRNDPKRKKIDRVNRKIPSKTQGKDLNSFKEDLIRFLKEY